MERVKVRIKTTPLEREMDGVSLDRLAPGTVREVSASIGSWLIAQGYALPEMRCLQDSEYRDGRRDMYDPAMDRRRRQV